MSELLLVVNRDGKGSERREETQYRGKRQRGREIVVETERQKPAFHCHCRERASGKDDRLH